MIPASVVQAARDAAMTASREARGDLQAPGYPAILRFGKVLSVQAPCCYHVHVLDESGNEISVYDEEGQEIDKVGLDYVRVMPPTPVAVGSVVTLVQFNGEEHNFILGSSNDQLSGWGYFQSWRDLGFAGCLSD